MDAGAPLDDFLGHDEYHAVAQCSNSVTVAGKQFGVFDAACAWHFSRRDQSSILGNQLSWCCYGTFGAGDRVVQTVCTLSDLGGGASHWTWHHFLATSGQKARRTKRMTQCLIPPISPRAVGIASSNHVLCIVA